MVEGHFRSTCDIASLCFQRLSPSAASHLGHRLRSPKVRRQLGLADPFHVHRLAGSRLLQVEPPRRNPPVVSVAVLATVPASMARPVRRPHSTMAWRSKLVVCSIPAKWVPNGKPQSPPHELRLGVPGSPRPTPGALGTIRAHHAAPPRKGIRASPRSAAQRSQAEPKNITPCGPRRTPLPSRRKSRCR